MKTHKQHLIEHLRTKIIHKLQEAKFDDEIELGTSRESAQDVIANLADSHEDWHAGNVRSELMPIEHAHELLAYWKNGTDPDMVHEVRKNPEYAMDTRKAMIAFTNAARQHPDFEKHRYPMLLPTHRLYGMTQEEVIAHHLYNIKGIAADRDKMISKSMDGTRKQQILQMMDAVSRREMSDLEHAKGSKPYPDEVDLSTMPPEPYG